MGSTHIHARHLEAGARAARLRRVAPLGHSPVSDLRLPIVRTVSHGLCAAHRRVFHPFAHRGVVVALQRTQRLARNWPRAAQPRGTCGQTEARAAAAVANGAGESAGSLTQQSTA